MAHTCEDCGETFETLTRLRLHDCPAAASESTDETDDDDLASDRQIADRQRSRQRDRERRARRITGDELDDALERAREGDVGGAVTALASFERELRTVLDEHGGDRFRDVFWGYYQRTVDAVDTVARAEGWSFLLEIAAAYDPHEDGRLPEITGVVANLVARGVVRTRLTDGVASVPAEALTYLGSIPTFDTEAFEITREESMHYGWGIGHPEVPVAETIRGRVSWEATWAGGAALRALYADQHAAVSLYCDLLRESEDREFAADSLSRFEGDPEWELFPRGWDIDEEFDREFAFTFDEAVERQLRETIEEIGLVAHLGADWTFEDLELRWD